MGALSNMFLRTSLAILVLSIILISARPPKKQRPRKEEMVRGSVMDVALRSRDHGQDRPGQGDCPQGWYDGNSVGLGCVLPGLNDLQTEGEFVWPVYGPANFTWWDDYYGEPDDYYEDLDCVEMQSAEFYALAWWTMYCDDTDGTIPV